MRNIFAERYIPRAEAMKRPWVKAYIERLRDLRFNPKTLEKKLFDIRIFLDWLDRDGPKPFDGAGSTSLTTGQGGRLQDMTPQHIEKFLACQRDRGLAGATIDGLIVDLRKFFRYLEDTQRIFVSPMANLKIRWTPKRLKPVPTEDEMRKLLAAPDTNSMFGLRDRALLETAYSTGARLNELLGMTIFDPDLDKGAVRVMGKGSKERIVPLGKQAILWIRQYLKTSRPRLLKERLDVHALWVGYDGSPLHKSRLEMMFGKYRDKAGIKTPVTPHTVRRACATHMLRHGAHPIQIQMLLGHATLNTLSQYLQVTITDMKKMHEQSKVGK